MQLEWLKKCGVDTSRFCRVTQAGLADHERYGTVGELSHPKRLSRQDENPKYSYLLRNVSAECPNYIWATDITYVRLKVGSVLFYVPDGNIGLVFALCVVS